MRRLAVFLSLLCLLSLPVSAAYIPESSVTENRDGRQLIIKTYQLSPEDDPSELVDEPFDLEGYHYEHLETVKEDQTFHDSKAHTETVTVTTSSDSLAAILEQLAPTMEYSKDGYSGVLSAEGFGSVQLLSNRDYWRSCRTPWGTWLAWASMAWADWIRMLFLV